MNARIVARRPIRFALSLTLLVVVGSTTAADESRAVWQWISGEGSGHLDRDARIARAHISDGRPLAGALAGEGADRLDLATEVAREHPIVTAPPAGELTHGAGRRGCAGVLPLANRADSTRAWCAPNVLSAPSGDAWASTRQFPGRPH